MWLAKTKKKKKWKYKYKYKKRKFCLQDNIEHGKRKNQAKTT